VNTPPRFVAGPGSGEFFQDTLQVLPCKLLASIDLQGGRKCRRIAGSNPCPAGDGPERTPPSLPLTLGFKGAALAGSAGLNGSVVPQRQANRGGEPFPGVYAAGRPHPSLQGSYSRRLPGKGTGGGLRPHAEQMHQLAHILRRAGHKVKAHCVRRKILASTQRLPNVLDQIIRVFEANGNADQIRR